MWVRTPKFLVKFKSKSRILGDGKLIPSGGGVPEGRRGSLTPMSGDGSLFSSTSTPNTPSEHPRDEQHIRSVPEHDEHSERVQFSAGHKAIKARGGEPLRACVYYAVFRRCQGREKFVVHSPKIFRRCSLTKREHVKNVNKSYRQRYCVWLCRRSEHHGRFGSKRSCSQILGIIPGKYNCSGLFHYCSDRTTL